MCTDFLFHRDVYFLSVSNSTAHPAHRTSQTFVKKKAALTLLRLYRKHPEVIPAAEWALRLVSNMDDPDLARFHTAFPCPSLTNKLLSGCCFMCDKPGYGPRSRSS